MDLVQVLAGVEKAYISYDNRMILNENAIGVQSLLAKRLLLLDN